VDFRGIYTGTEYNATLFVSDGIIEISHPLRFTVEGALPPPDITVNSVEVIPETDGWNVNIYAEEGQIIYMTVFDSEGGFRSFRINYTGGFYSVFIPDDMAGEDNIFIITNKPGGDEILPEFTARLPKLKEERESGDYTVYIILAVLLLIILIVLLLLITRRRKEEYYEE
jgi:hypothetical protein